MVLHGHATNKNRYISTTRVPMTSKLGTMITYLDGLLPIISNDLVTKYNHYISGIKVAIATKLCRMVTYLGHVVLSDHVTN